MRKKFRRFLLFFLAVIFIIEAWLWDITGRVVSYVVAHLPFERLKQIIAYRIEHFSPWLTLTVFLIPLLLLLPLKVVALWLFTKGHVFGGVSTVLFSKLAGLGVTSFLFTVCKPKLMQLRLIRWIYETLIHWKRRAKALVAPYMESIREAMRSLRALLPQSTKLAALRARVHKARQPKEWKDWH